MRRDRLGAADPVHLVDAGDGRRGQADVGRLARRAVGRHAQHDLGHPGDPGRHGGHEDGGGVDGPTARHVAPGPVDRHGRATARTTPSCSWRDRRVQLRPVVGGDGIGRATSSALAQGPEIALEGVGEPRRAATRRSSSSTPSNRAVSSRRAASPPVADVGQDGSHGRHRLGAVRGRARAGRPAGRRSTPRRSSRVSIARSTRSWSSRRPSGLLARLRDAGVPSPRRSPRTTAAHRLGCHTAAVMASDAAELSSHPQLRSSDLERRLAAIARGATRAPPRGRARRALRGRAHAPGRAARSERAAALTLSGRDAPRLGTNRGEKATAPGEGAVALRHQAADPGIAHKPGGGNLVGTVILLSHCEHAQLVLRQGSSDAAARPVARPTGRCRPARTRSHVGLAGEAHAAAVEDQPQAEVAPLGWPGPGRSARARP